MARYKFYIVLYCTSMHIAHTLIYRQTHTHTQITRTRRNGTCDQSDLWSAKQEQAATSQQLPSSPCTKSWLLTPSVNRWGSSQISCYSITTPAQTLSYILRWSQISSSRTSIFALCLGRLIIQSINLANCFTQNCARQHKLNNNKTI